MAVMIGEVCKVRGGGSFIVVGVGACGFGFLTRTSMHLVENCRVQLLASLPQEYRQTAMVLGAV